MMLTVINSYIFTSCWYIWCDIVVKSWISK